MLHKYQVTGMTCSSCEATVKSALLMVENVTNVEVSKNENSATITMDKHIAISDLQKALPEKYKISALHHSEITEQTKSWFETYKPILLIFFYITLVTLLGQVFNHHFDGMQWMQHFMAGFFFGVFIFQNAQSKRFCRKLCNV